MVDLIWIRLYELLSLVLAIGGLVYVIRRRNALYTGLFIGSAVGGGVFEWIFDTRWFFNLTPDPRLITMWSLDGVQSPAAMVFFYTFFFGIPLILLVEHSPALFRRFGALGTTAMLVVAAAVGVLLFEGFNTSVIQVYTYHQAPQYLVWGMPWSNLWFSPLIFVFAFWGAMGARRLVEQQNSVAEPGISRASAVAAGFAVLITSYFTAFTLNLIWYLAAQPWVESGRPF